MHRIDHATREIDANGVGKDGFTEGSPGVTPATVVTSDILNAVQEEICNVITGAGIALDKSIDTQLVEAIEAHAYRTRPQRTIAIPSTRFHPADPDASFRIHEFDAGTASLRLKTTGLVYCDLTGLVPHGATLVDISLILEAGSHLSAGKFYRVDKLITDTPSAASLVTEIGETIGTGLQIIQNAAVAAAVWTNDVNAHSVVYDPGSLDSGNVDYIEGAVITFFDPGPRNY